MGKQLCRSSRGEQAGEFINRKSQSLNLRLKLHFPLQIYLNKKYFIATNLVNRAWKAKAS